MSRQGQREGFARVGRFAAVALGCVLFVTSLVVLASSHQLDQLPFGAILMSQPAVILAVALLGIDGERLRGVAGNRSRVGRKRGGIGVGERVSRVAS